MRNWLYKVMAGRNGADNFTRFLCIVACVCLVIAMLLDGVAGSIFSGLALLSLIYCYFRAFSRNLSRRRAENARYLQAWGGIRSRFRQGREQFKMRKEYCFFKCPSCKASLRVPRGKGKVRITCRKCGQAFTKRT
jgi:hypothetical protein